jgi:regulator of sigma E protease
MHIALGFILVLGVLVLVHEWGHFIVARMFGVRVDVFSIGFGPRLFGFKRGATDWRVSAVPLGGYVRMAGQDITEIDSGDAKPTGAPDELMSKPRWQRALISFAGPAINLIFPIFLLTGYFAIMGEPHPKFEEKPLVIVDLQKDSPLAKAGVVAGDKIISLDGHGNPTWGTAFSSFDKPSSNRSFELVVDHEGVTRPVTVSTAGMQTPELLFGYPPDPPAIVGELDASLPAKAAGVQVGDAIESINGQKIESWPTLVSAIQQTDGKPLTFTVRRNGQLMPIQISPQKGSNDHGEPAWLVGIRPQAYNEYTIRHVNVAQAFVMARHETWSATQQVADIVVRLVSGKTSPKQLQSVIGIASMAGKAVEAGSYAVVQLMAVLSVNLGILNLLPIPILDGGNILLLSLEGLRRRDFSLSFKERFIQVGLVFLLVLFAYVMYNDVVRHLPKHL